jgi:hypothetical protein
VLILVLTLPLLSPIAAASPPPASEPSSPTDTPVSSAATLPLLFIENVGQFDPAARFQVRGAQGGLTLTDDALWLTALKVEARDAAGQSAPGLTLKLSFPNANPHPRLEPFQRLPTHVSYFMGSDPSQWAADVPVWGGVRYVELYPGIDLVVTSQGGVLSPRLVARTGADLGAVRLRVEGAQSISLEGDQLRLETAAGEFALPLLPVLGADGARLDTYTMPGAKPKVVNDQILRPLAGVVARRNLFSSWLSGWLSPKSGSGQTPPPGGEARPPATLLNPLYHLIYSTYLGGSSADTASDIVIHPSTSGSSAGFTYIVGSTLSTNIFPTSLYNHAGGWDIFIAKMDATGSNLSYLTYLGGTADEYGKGIAVDSSGSAFVTGWTSSGGTFPTTPNRFAQCVSGSRPVMSKLNASGTVLSYSTCIGSGEGHEIAVQPGTSGKAYLTGQAGTGGFPTTSGAFQATYQGGGWDGFMAKIDTGLSGANSLVYGTYVGGLLDDCETSTGQKECDIAVDANGAVYLTGPTLSLDFPTTPNAYSTVKAAGKDAFVLKLNPVGSGQNDLKYGTYLGGNVDECFKTCSIAVDATKNIYVTGQTTSNNLIPNPSTLYSTAIQKTANNSPEGFVAVFKAGATASTVNNYQLYRLSYLGGNGDDSGYAIAADTRGSAYIVGQTYSLADPPYFPTTPGAFKLVTPETETIYPDAFLTKFNPGATGWVYSSFLGGDFLSGDAADDGRGVVPSTNIYTTPAHVTGETASSSFPVISPGPRIFQPTYKQGGSDAFVTKMASPPVTTTSYYVDDMSTLASLGTKLGIHDRDTPGAQDNLVILDFGNPRRGPLNAYGTFLAFGNTFISTSYISSVAVQFAKNYDANADPASSLRLVIGTSNYGSETYPDLSFWEGHGDAWAAMMNSIQTQMTCCSQVTVVAGSDMEPEYNTSTNTRGWVDSYAAASTCAPTNPAEGGCLYNFGNNKCTSDSSECDETYPTWTQEHIWYISWGVKKSDGDDYTFARTLPEIYATPSTNLPGDAGYWQLLSDYSVTYHDGPIYFVGSLTTYARAPNLDSPDKGWMELWNALSSDVDTRPTALRWATDIKRQVDP